MWRGRKHRRTWRKKRHGDHGERDTQTPNIQQASSGLGSNPTPPVYRARPLSGASPSDDDLYEKTTVTMLQRDSPNTMFVDSYGLHGFTVNGNRVIGPCAIIPHAIIQWNVGSWKDISEESLSLFYLLEPRIEILVLGTGDRVERLDPQLLRFMTRQGVAVEVQDTGHACSTFNFLVNDRRLVAAGLIPPTQLA
ncbi:NADH dehydrogenase [ubiquinone] 1 alpha subcomplex assembly factor 3 isoform X1 [Lampetra planeri]